MLIGNIIDWNIYKNTFNWYLKIIAALFKCNMGVFI